jgi:hypothetical protein
MAVFAPVKLWLGNFCWSLKDVRCLKGVHDMMSPSKMERRRPRVLQQNMEIKLEHMVEEI